MSQLEKWDESVKTAKLMRTKVSKFQILKGSLLKSAQRIYCANSNFFSQQKVNK